MLLQFSVTNFLSFKDEVTLNMMPTKSRVMKDHEMRDDRGKSVRALPIATLYGANASGKSNLVNALEFTQKLVLQGTRAEASTGVTPHLLDVESEEAPSRFEFVFKHEGVVFTYGFCVSKKTVHEEWLFARFTSQESRLFERITQNGRTVVEAGQKLEKDAGGSQFIEYLARGTRPNQLFLTEANEKNVELIKPVVHWFRDHLQIIRPDSKYRPVVFRADTDQDLLDYISRFLRVADTGIEELQYESEPFDADKHLSNFPENLREQLIKNLEREKTAHLLFESRLGTVAFSKEEKNGQKVIMYRKLKSQHQRSDGRAVLFELGVESDGTRRMLDLAPALQDTWKRDCVFVIDELDRSLHTQLSRFFIESVIEAVSGKEGRGQFIMTTHDTNLLDRNLLRRDEIWFLEKDAGGASHMTSLAEYKVSEGLNYQNGYLNGRFGAIPFIGNHRKLLK